MKWYGPILTTCNMIDLRQKLIFFWVIKKKPNKMKLKKPNKMKFFVWLKQKRKKKKKQELNRIQVQLLQKRQTTKPNQISSAPLFTLIHFSFFSLVHTPKSNLSLSLSHYSETQTISLSLSGETLIPNSIRKCRLRTTNRWWWTPGQEESGATPTNRRRRRTISGSVT